MASFSGKYFKVWKIKEENGFRKIDLGDGKKNKDGTYTNFTWFDVALFGDAKLVKLSEGDKVEIKSGLISKRKYNDKWYDDVVIFDLEVMESGQDKQAALVKEVFEDDIPF
jgi:hypothetical protein